MMSIRLEKLWTPLVIFVLPGIGDTWKQTTLHISSRAEVNLLTLSMRIISINSFNSISADNTFVKRFKHLLNEYPTVDTSLMGFPIGWENEPIWKQGNEV